MTTTTIITEAIKFEEEGISLYTELGKKAEDKITERLFNSLVVQEKAHIEYILKYSRDKRAEDLFYVPLEKEIKEIYDSMQKESSGKPKMSDLEGYELALKLEDKGYKLYKNAAGKAADDEDKDFFSFLAKMEQGHYEALANVYNYFADNAKWLAENESHTWSWMNL